MLWICIYVCIHDSWKFFCEQLSPKPLLLESVGYGWGEGGEFQSQIHEVFLNFWVNTRKIIVCNILFIFFWTQLDGLPENIFCEEIFPSREICSYKFMKIFFPDGTWWSNPYMSRGRHGDCDANRRGHAARFFFQLFSVTCVFFWATPWWGAEFQKNSCWKMKIFVSIYPPNSSSSSHSGYGAGGGLWMFHYLPRPSSSHAQVTERKGEFHVLVGYESPSQS
jgi:hypothetical protein